MIDASSPESLDATLAPLAAAYVPGAVLGAALELDLFAQLREPIGLTELASRVNGQVDGVGRLVRALVALGLVEHRGDAGFVAPHAERLSRDGAGDLAALFLHHQHHVAPMLARVADAVRTGRRQHAAWRFASDPPAASAYAELSRNPEEYELFLRAMDRESRGVGERIAAQVDLSSCARLLDLGCGGGAVARGLLRSVPTLIVESFDLAPAAAFAARRSRDEGLEARHRVETADIRMPVDVSPAPVVLLSAVLADFPPDERALVLRHAASKVEPGGMLLVSETLIDDDREGPPMAAVLSLLMLAAFGGDQLSARELTALLADAGLAHVRALRGTDGGRDLIVATKG